MADRGDNETDIKSTRPSRAITGFTGVLAVVGVIGVIIAALQWQTIKQTNQAAQNTNRAFVYFGRISVQPDAKDPVYGVAVSLTNSGNTPTGRLLVRVDCKNAPTSTPTTEPFAMFKWNEKKPIKSVLGPRQTVVQRVCLLSEKIITQITDRTTDQFIVGEARYEDILTRGKLRKTRFVRQLFFRDKGYSIHQVGKNNCSDNDCPEYPRESR